MKILFIPFLLLGIALNSNSSKESDENTSGTIVYEEVMKFNIELEGENAAFADMMPSESKSEKILYFNSKASLYSNIEKEEEENSVIEQESEGVMVIVEMSSPDDKVYCDLENKENIEQTEFMSRLFLIVDEAVEFSWKLTGNQKMILDYQCQEAIYENEEGDITTAWFTPQIPISVGPSIYSGLPGAILSISMEGGDYEIVAKSITIGGVDESVLIKPKKGKKVSRKDYEKIVEEKNKEMEEQYGSGGEGGVFIQIETR